LKTATDKIIDNFEDSLSDLGSSWQPRFKDRAREILTELAKNYPITGLNMGMGDYNLLGSDVVCVYTDDPSQEGTMDLDDLLDWGRCPDNHRTWPKGATVRHAELLTELAILLEYVSQPHIHIATFELTL